MFISSFFGSFFFLSCFGLALARNDQMIQFSFFSDSYDFSLFSRLKTAVNITQKNCGKQCYSIFAHSGDFLSPSILSSIDKGKSNTKIMKEMGLDFFTLGNHDFDKGIESLQDALKSLTEANTKVMCSNVKIDTNPIYCIPYDIITPFDNVVIGIAGLMLDTPDELSAESISSLTIKSPIDTMKELHDSHPEVNYWVVFTHLPLDMDEELANSGLVSLILGGHDHDKDTRIVNHVPIVKPGMDAEYLAVVEISGFGSGKSLDFRINHLATSSFAPDPKIQMIVDKVSQVISEMEKSIIFQLPSSDNIVYSTKNLRLEESSMVTLLLSHIKNMLDTDVAIICGGNIKARKDFEENVTIADFYGMFPYDSDRLIKVNLPGYVIQQAIEYTRRNMGYKEEAAFLHVNKEVELKQTDENGWVIQSINKKEFDPYRLYSVAVNSPLLLRKDNVYPILNYLEQTNTSQHISGLIPEIKIQLIDYFLNDYLVIEESNVIEVNF